MSHEDNGPTQGIAGKQSGSNTIMQVLRRYFDHPVLAQNRIPGSTNEGLIIKALKRYFKGDGWP
jgi:hypothetical protein